MQTGNRPWKPSSGPVLLRSPFSTGMMPKLTGLDICEHLKSFESRNDKYIIILSVKDSKEEVAKGFQAGADDT